MNIDQVFVRNWQKSFISICTYLLINSLLIASQDALALTKPTLNSPANNATIITTSVTFTWSHPYNDKYEVKIKTNGGALKYASGKISSKSKTVDLSSIPLTYNSNYKWYVVVYANGQETSSADSWFTYKSDTTKPVVSSFGVTPSSVTLGGSFSINYTASDAGGSGLKQVELWRANDSGGSPSGWAQITTRSLSGNGPATGSFSNIPSAAGTYWYGIHVVDNAGNLVTEPTPRKVTVVAPIASPPPVPTLNTPSNGATNVPKANVNFSWSSSGATSYQLVISQNSAFSGFNGSSTCDNTCFTTVTTSNSRLGNMNLDGTTYYWKVRAYNSGGASGWPVVRTFTTAGQTKTTPLDLSYMQNRNVAQGFGGWNSNFGGYHTGYDIGTANSNPSVYAIEDGTVVWNSTSSTKYTTNYTKYFNAFVIIKHGNFYAYYGHLNSSLNINSTVKKGVSIGSIRDAYTSSDKLNKENNHLHISISTDTSWIKSGWGYQTTLSGLNQFVNPGGYIGL